MSNGLSAWRERQAEERRQRLEELERYRAEATTEVRDGQEFKVVRIPDRYDFSIRPKPRVQSRRGKKKAA